MISLSQARFTQSLPCRELSSAKAQQLPELAARFPQQLFPEGQGSLVLWNEALAQELGISQRDSLVPELLGQRRAPDGFAYNYSGHQFGHWAGQLGDGRALVLGELPDMGGQIHELQLKGSGPTPFSRRGDGFAVLRSSLREYLASEAMHRLGIASTRALSLGLTGSKVLRDRFYDGHPEYEPGAIICRTAPSHIRFGHFEHLAAQQQTADLAQLVDFVVAEFYPELSSHEQQAAKVLAFFAEVRRRTARLLAQWQAIGFTHGVMNTDNMSILGLTIDYGPYGFMEAFDSKYTPNTTDLPGRRYCYGRQPSVAAWNLARLAEALSPLCPGPELQAALDDFGQDYSAAWLGLLASKLALDPGDQEAKRLIQELFKLLERFQLDMVFVFRELSEALSDQRTQDFTETLASEAGGQVAEAFEPWLQNYLGHVGPVEEAGVAMCQLNPRLVPRNHNLVRVLEGLEAGQREDLEQFQAMIQSPYERWQGLEEWFRPAPQWARAPTIQMNSCSS